MSILFMSPDDDPAEWREMLAEWLPEKDFRVWPAGGKGLAAEEVSGIEHAIVWQPEPGVLRSLPNLKVIHSLGAGVDHIFKDPDLPEGVPVVRLIDRCLTQGMSEYVLYWVIHYHRNLGVYADNIARQDWRHLPQADAEKRRVGVLGLGELGGDAARKLAAMHYQVAGWSRSPKTVPGVTCFTGEAELENFLARTEILICLLPLTPETAGILNKRTLAALPEGAVLINCARGGHLVDEDLIDALATGHLRAATLDVFHQEPLPSDHPFWHHPKVTITPHMASLTVVASGADWIVGNILRWERGEPLKGIVDPKTGY